MCAANNHKYSSENVWKAVVWIILDTPNIVTHIEIYAANCKCTLIINKYDISNWPYVNKHVKLKLFINMPNLKTILGALI